MKKTSIYSLRSAAFASLAGAFALSLAACQAEEPSFEADAEDMSGGELIVAPEDAEGVDVELPETPMTPVAESAEVMGDEAMDAAAE